MEIDVEHILDCFNRYGKGELTGEQVNEALTADEKMFLLMHQDFFEIDEEDGEDFDVLNWLGEEDSFFMVVEIDEILCREAESVLEEIGVEMPDDIGAFLKQLVKTKQFPIVTED
ncbi:hypothetical protein IGI96_003203 [Enterococcus sp. DIV0421]|uniref:damage-inducible protein J n=1 Tax=Enterococcus TaxID=1350 RepID=UPI001E44051E|nr:damage-inducible protein J [Enterococcus faecium]MCD4983311.1 damage-inducible protein J [Enterococcus faecium]MDW7860691.1 damage-inducible protein J [Enterococcus faecium]